MRWLMAADIMAGLLDAHLKTEKLADSRTDQREKIMRAERLAVGHLDLYCK